MYLNTLLNRLPFISKYDLIFQSNMVQQETAISDTFITIYSHGVTIVLVERFTFSNKLPILQLPLSAVDRFLSTP